MTFKDPSAADAVDLDYVLALAIRLHQAQELDDAEDLYRTILEQFPAFPEALHFLGLLRHQKGDDEQAIALIEQAIVHEPAYSDAHNNLGNIFNRMGLLEKAAESYSKALELNPNNAAAFNNFGVVLNQLSRLDEAVGAFINAITLMPNNGEFYRNLGNAYKKKGEFTKSIDAYRKVLGLKPYKADNYENLCMVLNLQGRVEDAMVIVKQWLEFDPDNPLALHRLYSYTGELALPRAADDYIEQTFDGFADSFDMVLKRLDYKAPFLVADAVKEIAAQSSKALDILDAGCGTGLCGPLIKTCAQNLVGVDLSAKMLERAEMRNCYDALFQAELTAFIAGYAAGFDVIVSADTLVYFGDLEPVCQVVALALREDGFFVFTLERAKESVMAGYKIHPHGRFSHAEAYIKDVIKSAKLSLVKLEEVRLRYEAGVPVDGFLVVASKILNE